MVVEAKNSAILNVPHLSSEELEDRDSLIELVIAMSKKIDRDRRREHSELLKKIQLCKNDLITARSLVPPSAMHNDPTVLSVRYRL